MPSINDIMTVAEALEKSPVVVMGDKCVVVRNRNATCRRCEKACPASAIEIEGNEIHLSGSACISCGICTVLCPTEALVPVDPTDAALAEAAGGSCDRNDGCAVFACARIASKHVAAPDSFAEVPCLSRIDESILLSMASLGAQRALLVDGDCSTCKYRGHVPFVEASIAYAKELLAVQGCDMEVERITGFPDEMKAGDVSGQYGTTRRGFFSEAFGAARDTAMTAAKTTVAQELGYDASVPAIGERLRVTAGGTLPHIRAARHEVAINAMDLIGRPVRDEVESRLFGSVSIEAEKCNACGMCAVFCPTGAIRRGDDAKPSEPLAYLEFSASSCVQCGLCADVCWKKALTLSPTVSTGQLFDFEPVVFDLRAAKRSANSPFGKSR